MDDGKGLALDNIRTERFFRAQKYDLIYTTNLRLLENYERPLTTRSMSTIHFGPIHQSGTYAQISFIMASLPQLPDNIKTIKEIN